MITEEKLIELIAVQLGCPCERLTSESSIHNTPEWDSISHYSVITSISELLSREIPPDHFYKLTSVKEIQSYVESIR